MRRTTQIFSLLGGVFISVGATASSAATIDLGFLGLDLVYGVVDIGNGPEPVLYDAKSLFGGSGDPAEADPLDAVAVEVDGLLAGPVITSDIYADVLIPVDIPLPSSPGVSVSASGEGVFDLLIDAGELLLDVDEVTITFVDAVTASFAFGGEITSDISEQDLPFGLVMGTPVELGFNATIDSGSITDNGVDITGFTASGSGNITGPLVPEPAGVALTGLVVFCSVANRQRVLR